MKYYEMHELVYRRLQNEAVLAWDESKTFEELWQHSTNVFLEKFLNKRGISFNALRVLDLGTGTGTSALFSAQKGAVCSGVEISSSAISIAKENAKKLNLNIEFIVADVLGLDLKQKFSLVIDSTVLHCIVGHVDRKSFYESVKRHMQQNSYFMVNTMIAVEDMSSLFPAESFIFQDNILWSLGISEITERKTIGDKTYFPHRTILSESLQLEEFKQNSFEVVELEILDKKGGGKDMLVLLRLA